MGAKHNRKLVDKIVLGILRDDSTITTAVLVAWKMDKAIGAPLLRDIAWDTVLAKVKRMRPETWGRICATGRAHTRERKMESTSLAEVHDDRAWLDNWTISGKNYLIGIATTTIIARMWDYLEADLWLRAQSEATADSPSD